MGSGGLAHGGTASHLLEGFAQFGSDWLYVGALPALVAAGTVAFFIAGRRPVGSRGLDALAGRLGDGLERASLLPAWVVAPLALVLGGVLPLAVLGFFWDVAWHIDIGRDDFLFSPPHVALASSFLLLGVAGGVSVLYASRGRVPTSWHYGRLRLPAGAVGLLAASATAFVGFFMDELWHWAYGLDVSMWGPSHLAMISALALSPLFAWLLLAEAGRGVGRTQARMAALTILALALLEGLSAWQLEFDLGVPQWQQLYQPVLIALAGGFGLVAARAAVGRGGALLAAGGFLALRTGLFALTSGAWGLSEPRFPLYLGAAIAVEAVFLLERRLPPLPLALLAGTGVGTVGLAGEWAWSQVGFWHPWTASLFPAIFAATAVAVAAAVLGVAFGRAVALDACGIRPAHAAGALLVTVVALVVPFPRHVPDGKVTVTTSPPVDGRVEVAVEVDPSTAVDDPDRWEVLSWQGNGHQNARLVPSTPGRFRADRPVPVDGDWKSLVRFARKDRLGAVAVFLPADPEIGASAVPLVTERTQPFEDEQALLLREAHDGPRWPAILTYGFVGASIATLLGLVIAGVAHLDRRARDRATPGERLPEPVNQS